MKWSFRTIAFTLSATFLAFMAAAQDVSKGSIQGVVKDATGAVIADANVTLSGPTGEKKAKTGSLGEYTFASLTPGTDYMVTVEKQGFSTAKLGGVVVALNRQTTADVTLQVGATAQSVEVSAGVETVDLNSTGVGANLNENLYKNVAAGRNISSIINFAPGVTASQGAGTANPSINGASGLENEYVINGSDVTDSGFGGFGTYSRVFGPLGNGVNFDFIQEVQVKTGGFEAQYGEALGGVVNVITKSGTNTLHGSLYGYFAPQQFEAERPNANPLLVSKGTYREHQGSYDFGADIGGAIKKDKLFYYGGFNPTFLRNYDIADPSFANYILGTQVLKIFTPNYTGKLNWNITDKHTLEGTVFGDPTTTNTQYWRGPNGSPVGSPTDNLRVSSLDYGSRTWSGRYTGTLTPNWIVTAAYTDHYNHFNEYPLHNGYLVTDNSNPAAGTLTYGGLGSLENYESLNHIFNISSSHIFTLGGNHSLDIGFQLEDQPYNDIILFSGPNITLPNDPFFGTAAGQTQYGATVTRTHVGVSPNKTIGSSNPADPNGPIVERVTRGNYSSPNVQVGSRYYSGFLQDSWTIGHHLTIKPGIRFEQQSMHGEFLHYTFAHNWAPRMGVIFDPTGQRKSKIFANWGRFFEKIPNDIAIRAFSFETSAIGAYYKDSGLGNSPDLSPANWCGASTHPCGAGITGPPLSFQGDPSLAELVYGGTGSEYQDEVVAGYEKEFGNKLTFSGRFVYRHMLRIIEDISGVNSTQANNGVPQQYVVANPSASLDIFHNFTPCTSGPNCDLGSGYNDLNQPVLGADGVVDGFPNASRIYKAAELVVSRRFASGMQLYASYVLSKLYGNFQGSFRGDNGQTDPNISSLFDFTNSDGLLTGQFTPGVLPTDRTHQIKLYGNYTFKNVNFGLSWQILSGVPITKLLDHPVYLNNGEVPVCPDGTFTCPGGPRGAFGRSQWQYPLDLHADYTFKLSEKANLKFLADLFDVMNKTWVQYPDMAAELTNSPGTPNPDFLKPGGDGGSQIRDAYTRPFYARLGVRFEF